MIDVIQLIAWMLVALFVLVSIHEFGHFWVARLCGVRVLRYSIGFGKPFLRWQRGETEFALAPIPLGGYVKMYGEGQSDTEIPADQEAYSFSHKNVWQRMAIVVAGPVANFLLAILLFFMVYSGGLTGIAPRIGDVAVGSEAERAGLTRGMEVVAVDGASVSTWNETQQAMIKRIGETGFISLETLDYSTQQSPQNHLIPISRWLRNAEQPDVLGELGITPFYPPVTLELSYVEEGGPAARAGLMVGDTLLRVDSLDAASWETLRDLFRNSPGVPLAVTYMREGLQYQTQLTPAPYEDSGVEIGRVGIAPSVADWPEDMRREIDGNPLHNMRLAVARTGEMSLVILDSLKKMVTGLVSTKSIGGPIAIAKYAGASADAGWQSYLLFMASLSVMLGVMNLLPIPLLDGGHLLFYIVEAVKGSPLNEAIQGVALRIGASLLFGIMLLALYNDFMRL